MVNEISNKALSVQDKQVANDVNVKPVKSEAALNGLDISRQDSKQQEPTVSLVTDTVNRLNQAVQSIERDLQFKVDESSGDTIITVLDTKTEEVIRQIPTEEVLAVRENIETLKGILFSAKV